MSSSITTPRPNGGDIRGKTGVGYQRDLWVPNSFDYTAFEDSFDGDLINPFYPAAKVSSGTVTFTADNQNKFLEIKSGSSNDNYAGQGLGLNYTGDRGFLAEFIIKLPSSLTNFKFECGVTDSHSVDAGAVNTKSDPTASPNATDYGVFILDTDENTQFDFMTDGSGLTQRETLAVLTVAASDVLRLVIRVDNNNVEAWCNDIPVAQHTEAIEGGNKLTPWIFCQARAGAERIVQLYKWRVTQPAY